MRLRTVKEPFDDPDYIFELKHDGFRAIVYLEDGECRLVSRNLKNLRFESLKKALSELPVENAILDGEIICLDRNGVSQVLPDVRKAVNDAVSGLTDVQPMFNGQPN